MSNVTIGPPGAGALPTASTIDATQDYLPIFTNSSVATQAINRNTLLGLVSAPVGLSDTQVLTNKTLTSPTLTTPTLGVATATSINKITITQPASSATLTIANGKTLTASNSLTLAGTDSTTMTFPSSSDTVVTLGATQTLTNKTLTSPVIGTSILDTNANTLLGLTATASAVNYLTLADSATTHAPTFTATGSDTNINIGLTAKGTGFIQSTPPIWQYLGYAQITANPTNVSSATSTQVSGLTSTVTIPSGVTKVRVTAFIGYAQAGAALIMGISIWDGIVNSGTKISEQDFTMASSGYVGFNVVAIVAPAAGSKTYNVGAATSTNAATINASSIIPSFILVECC